ncbi:PEP-CTERM sorting domain-containing protein [Bythopirellula polymerisocia]|uniref:PEP-CTERM protein-sorting domain-containing protein n=1 Tax=Bythopirellula polymerisocia TaxID=2528003 RepID=A0A5C6D0R4_9BACT|nr:PEP-CTERM sorting domain-containing protein [Bythopirellula polymerisocia]TWU29755.1 hypothetical protein Pla144_05340 [Bythopirellula polymerisocia]
MLIRATLRLCLPLAASLVVSMVATSECLAKKKGGNPGGGDPPAPTAPVSYLVTSVGLPGGNFQYSNHDDASAVVGWTNDTPVGRRATAYLPSISSSNSFFLTSPEEKASLSPAEAAFALEVGGIDDGWHTRSAIGVNSNGMIVGNLEPFSSENTITKPFLLATSGGSPYQLSVLGPFDTNADKESALRINNSLDILISSEKTVSGIVEKSLLIGNWNSPATIQKVQFPSGWEVQDFDALQLSDSIGSDPAIIAGRIVNSVSGEQKLFRMNFDHTNFEFAEPYINSFGSEYQIGDVGPIDMNDKGDITAIGILRTQTRGKKSNARRFAASWAAGTSEYLPVGADDANASDWLTAFINNDGDALLNYDTLLNGDWSEGNGLLNIADLIDVASLDGAHFESAMELTDRRDNGWPTIIAQGSRTIDGVSKSMLLILDPVLKASTLASTTAVPEPATWLLLSIAAQVCVLGRWRRRAKHVSNTH